MEPPVLDMKAVLDDSSTKTPLIFVLSPGVVCSKSRGVDLEQGGGGGKERKKGVRVLHRGRIFILKCI